MYIQCGLQYNTSTSRRSSFSFCWFMIERVMLLQWHTLLGGCEADHMSISVVWPQHMMLMSRWTLQCCCTKTVWNVKLDGSISHLLTDRGFFAGGASTAGAGCDSVSASCPRPSSPSSCCSSSSQIMTEELSVIISIDIDDNKQDMLRQNF
jgi:hypothetical protein